MSCNKVSKRVGMIEVFVFKGTYNISNRNTEQLIDLSTLRGY